MTDTVIQVENLGKRYVLGQAQGRRGYRTLRESLVEAVKTPWRRLRAPSPAPDAPPAGEFWALRDVSFEIKRGEVMGIIGRNGAGKSTLLKILSRITEPTTGRIGLKGRVASLLEVGTGFHPELTGRENIFLNGAILGMQRHEIRAKFDEIVAFAEVERFLDTPVKRYSSGMYVRLAFAVAAHMEPEILVVDEVLAVGDSEFQKKCLGKMQDVARGGGRTVLFVSHNMQAVSHLCSNAMLLRAGKLQAVSSDVTSIIKHYLNPDDRSQPAVWENTFNGWSHRPFTPLRMFVGDEHGVPLHMPVSRDQPMWVYVQGRVDDYDPALQVGYELFSEEGLMMYMSFTTDQEESAWPIRAAGEVSVRSPLPGETLNVGRYRIELSVGLRWRQWFCSPGAHAPTIEIELASGEANSPYRTEDRPGLLAPLIRWETARS